MLVSLAQSLVDGILVGGVYAVISIGLTLVFGIMGLVNFAQAEFMMVGMFVAYFSWLKLGLDPLLGSVLSFAVAFGLGYGLQRTVIRRVLEAPAVAQVFLTVGLLIALENGALLAFGSQLRSVSTSYQTLSWRVGELYVSVPYLAAFAMSGLSGGALWLFLKRSRVGQAMRATAQDPMAAKLVGIDTDLLQAVAFGLGVGLTAFGGAVVLPYVSVFPSIGGQFVVLMFTVAVLGGLGSVSGAIVGGLAVGVITSVSSLFLRVQLQNLVLFLVFIAVLSFRPDGLIGSRR